MGRPSGEYVSTYYEVTVAVVRVFKGDRQPGERLVIQLDSLYTRRLLEAWGDPSPPRVPLGRALFFLTQKDGVWQPVGCGVKLLMDGEAYTYGQFASNPGALYLARMLPENTNYRPPFNEEALLADLGVALEKAKSLTAPVRLDPSASGVPVSRRSLGLKPTPTPVEPATADSPPVTLVAAVAAGWAAAQIAGVWWWRRRRSSAQRAHPFPERPADGPPPLSS